MARASAAACSRSMSSSGEEEEVEPRANVAGERAGKSDFLCVPAGLARSWNEGFPSQGEVVGQGGSWQWLRRLEQLL